MFMIVMWLRVAILMLLLCTVSAIAENDYDLDKVFSDKPEGNSPKKGPSFQLDEPVEGAHQEQNNLQDTINRTSKTIREIAESFPPLNALNMALGYCRTSEVEKDKIAHYSCLSGIEIVKGDLSMARYYCNSFEYEDKIAYKSCLSGIEIAKGDLSMARYYCNSFEYEDKIAYNSCLSGIEIAKGDLSMAQYYCYTSEVEQDKIAYYTCLSGIEIAKGNLNMARYYCYTSEVERNKVAYYTCLSDIEIAKYIDQQIQQLENNNSSSTIVSNPEIQQLESEVASLSAQEEALTNELRAMIADHPELLEDLRNDPEYGSMVSTMFKDQ